MTARITCSHHSSHHFQCLITRYWSKSIINSIASSLLIMICFQYLSDLWYISQILCTSFHIRDDHPVFMLYTTIDIGWAIGFVWLWLREPFGTWFSIWWLQWCNLILHDQIIQCFFHVCMDCIKWDVSFFHAGKLCMWIIP